MLLAWICRRRIRDAATARRQVVLAIGLTLAGAILTGVGLAFDFAITASAETRRQHWPVVLFVYPYYGVLAAVVTLPLTGAAAFAGVLALRWVDGRQVASEGRLRGET
jgi:mannose/fructose/N-acetylgalactosamine-specific phosphotransferase system component IIC